MNTSCPQSQLGLNPFEYRAREIPGVMATVQRHLSLNPFEYRAREIPSVYQSARPVVVLIPLNTGRGKYEGYPLTRRLILS